MCPGFVQTHKSVYLGATITNVSVPSGPQFQTTISLHGQRVKEFIVNHNCIYNILQYRIHIFTLI